MSVLAPRDGPTRSWGDQAAAAELEIVAAMWQIAPAVTAAVLYVRSLLVVPSQPLRQAQLSNVVRRRRVWPVGLARCTSEVVASLVVSLLPGAVAPSRAGPRPVVEWMEVVLLELLLPWWRLVRAFTNPGDRHWRRALDRHTQISLPNKAWRARHPCWEDASGEETVQVCRWWLLLQA